MSLETEIRRDANPTPTRFLLECGAITPGFGLEGFNPFDASLKFLNTPKAELNPFDTSFKTPSNAISGIGRSTTSAPTTIQTQEEAPNKRHPWVNIMMDDVAMPMPQMSPGLSPSSSSASPSPPISSPPITNITWDQYRQSATTTPHTADSHTYSYSYNDEDQEQSQQSIHNFSENTLLRNNHSHQILYHSLQNDHNPAFSQRQNCINHIEHIDVDERNLEAIADDSGVDNAMAALRMRRQSEVTPSLSPSSLSSSSPSSPLSLSSQSPSSLTQIDLDPEPISTTNVTAKSNKPSQATTSRKTRKRSRGQEESPEVKRQKFLERNRMAASKCREKKRLQTLKIISDADEITVRNQTLHENLNELQEEIRLLKNQILCHRDCECDVIQRLLQNSLDVTSLSNNASTDDVSHSHHASAFAPSFRI
ncbi:Cyclic AMP-dependent transcription factor ATF-7 [Linnemannia zychae]|nr:Cyclic AMP-dependent transcription factor ATF-7 [Linnemannia zychae]